LSWAKKSIKALLSILVLFSANGVRAFEPGVFGPGVKWSHIGLEKKHVNSLSIDSKGELVASTPEGLFHATEIGKPWEKIDTKELGVVLAMVIGGNDAYYVGTAAKGVFRSTDRGKTWENILQKKFHPLTILQLAVSPTDPKRIFAVKGQYTPPVPPSKDYRNQAFARMGGGDPDDDFTPYRPPANIHLEQAALLSSASNGDKGTWEVVLRPSNQAQPLQSLSFSGMKACIVSHPSTVHCSEDGGKTFPKSVQIPEAQANTVLDDQGNLITSGSTLAYLNPQKGEWVPLATRGSVMQAVGLRTDGKGNVFVVANAALPGWPTPGVFMLKNRRWLQLSPTELDLTDPEKLQRAVTIKEIVSDSAGHFFVTTENGIFLVERQPK